MKKIFITGASSGIGRATATMAAEHGHEVWGTSRDPARLLQMSRFHPIALDLAEPQSIEQAFATAVGQAGHLDVVINNAGSGHFGSAENLSAEAIAHQFEILVFAQVRLMQLALPGMRERNAGLIINVTSLVSRLPVPFMAAYNSAKAALAVFTMSIQLELEQSGVHIVDLQPADICTDFNDSMPKDDHDPRYKMKIRKTWEMIERNMKAAPKPELVARQILRLINATHPPPRLTVGGAFQAKVAPAIFRFLPQRLRIWGLRKYYGI